MAVPKPPQPGASVTVKYNIGSAAGVVTRVVQSQVYVCFEGEAAEWEEPIDWRDPDQRACVTVAASAEREATAAKPPRRVDRRTRAEKATGWGGPARRRRRKPAAATTAKAPKRQSAAEVAAVEEGSPSASGAGVPFVRTPSGRLIGSPVAEAEPEEDAHLEAASPPPSAQGKRASPGTVARKREALRRMSASVPMFCAHAEAAEAAACRTSSYRALATTRHDLSSQEEQLEAQVRRLEEELEDELVDEELQAQLGGLSLGDAQQHAQAGSKISYFSFTYVGILTK